MELDKKLTLSLDEAVIEKAKAYVNKHNTSLSKLFETYLLYLTQREDAEVEISPLVQELSGIVQLPVDTDESAEYRNYLHKKYE